MKKPNHWLQARPGYALLFVLAPWPGLPEPKRYASMRRITLITLLGLSTLLLLGCPARWEVVFINGADQPLSAQLSGSLDGFQRSFTLEPGHAHSELEQRVQHLAIFNRSATLLFQRDDFGSKALAPPVPGKYPHVYVLLTATNVYLVPAAYRKTWKEHIDEITKPRA